MLNLHWPFCALLSTHRNGFIEQGNKSYVSIVITVCGVHSWPKSSWCGHCDPCKGACEVHELGDTCRTGFIEQGSNHSHCQYSRNQLIYPGHALSLALEFCFRSYWTMSSIT